MQGLSERESFVAAGEESEIGEWEAELRVQGLSE